MNFSVNQLSATGAAEVVGLDCSIPLAADDLATLQQAFRDNPVIVIRGQNLSAAQQGMFSRQFGSLERQDQKSYCHPRR